MKKFSLINIYTVSVLVGGIVYLSSNYVIKTYFPNTKLDIKSNAISDVIGLVSGKDTKTQNDKKSVSNNTKTNKPNSSGKSSNNTNDSKQQVAVNISNNQTGNQNSNVDSNSNNTGGTKNENINTNTGGNTEVNSGSTNTQTSSQNNSGSSTSTGSTSSGTTTPTTPEPTPTPVPTTPTPTPTPTPAPSGTLPDIPTNHEFSYLSQVEQDVLKYTNIERQKAGLSTLTWNDTLAKIGRYKSNEMLQYNYFSHNSPYVGMAWDVAKKIGYDYTTIGENLYTNRSYPLNSITGEDIVKAWMNSPGHKANILNPDFHKIGIGVVFAQNGNDNATNCYGTQIFSN